MKKLILVLCAVTIFPYNLHAMDNQHITAPQFTHATITSQTGFTYGIPLFSHDISHQSGSFNNQDQADCKAQIEAAQDIIEQYKALNDVYTNMQSHKIQNHNEFITQITAVYNKAQQEPSGVKAYDPLIQDQDILKYANINQPISLEQIPTYNLILLAQQYLTSEYSLSPIEKLALCNQINPLLRTQPLLWNDISQYSPQTLEAFSSFLPMIYDKIWNSYKFMITSRLLQTLNTAKTQQGSLAGQLNSINEMRAILHNQTTQYENAFVAINSRVSQVTSTENVMPHHESAPAEFIKTNSQITVAIPTETEQVIQDTQVALQPQSAEKAHVSEQIVVMNASKKSLPLSKKQLAALAAEKKAEQSRIDKERHRLILEQKNAEEKTKLTTIMPVIAAAIKPSSSKTIQKKSVNKTNKKSKQATDEDFDAILNLAIAQDNSKFIQEASTQFDQAIKTQINSEPIAPKEIVTEKFIEQPVELIEYLEFIEARNIKFLEIEQAKEIQRKANLKKLCSIKSHDRERVKRELETALNKNFNIITEQENEIILLLNAYAYAIDRKNINAMPLESFRIIEHKIIDAEKYLQKQGHSLTWYLAAHPAMYASIKEKYIKFRAIMEQTAHEQERFLQNEYANNPGFTEAEKNTMRQDLHDVSPLHKQEAILESLNKFHTNNGILDISRLMYPMKTRDELATIGTLSPAVLQQAQEDIKFLYAGKTNIDYSLIQPIVDNLIHQAYITTPPQDLVKDMINLSAVIVQSKGDKEKLFSEFDTNVFYRLQRSNEMSIAPLTDPQMADITKLHMAVLSTLVEIEQARA